MLKKFMVDGTKENIDANIENQNSKIDLSSTNNK